MFQLLCETIYVFKHCNIVSIVVQNYANYCHLIKKRNIQRNWLGRFGIAGMGRASLYQGTL
jgi:hypothetical protein